MKGKYDKSNNQFHEVEDKVYDSNLWKNIVSVWPVMNDMVYWAIGNGENVNSWEDYWVQREINLSSLRSYLYYAHRVVRVDNLVDSNGEWDLEQLSSLLPQNTYNDMMIMYPPIIYQWDNVRMWRGTTNSNFTISSAFDKISMSNNNRSNTDT